MSTLMVLFIISFDLCFRLWLRTSQGEITGLCYERKCPDQSGIGGNRTLLDFVDILVISSSGHCWTLTDGNVDRFAY